MWLQYRTTAPLFLQTTLSRVASFVQELLYLYGVAFLISAVCSLIHHATGLDRPVVLWGCAEVAFFLYSRWRFRQLHIDIPRFPVALNSEEQFEYFLSASGAVSIQDFFSGWFLHVPYDQIKKDNVKDFISYAFMYKLRRELNSKERALLNVYVKRIEDEFGVKFQKGYNIGLKYMAHVFEPLRVMHKPLIWHAFAEITALLSHALLLWWRFDVYYTPDLTFWVHDPVASTHDKQKQSWWRLRRSTTQSILAPTAHTISNSVLRQLYQAWTALRGHIANFLDAVFPPADTPWLQGPRLMVPIDVAAWLQYGPRLPVNAAAWLQQRGPRLMAPINVAAWLQQQAPLLDNINVGAWLQQQGPLMAAPMQAAAWLQQQGPLMPMQAAAWLQQQGPRLVPVNAGAWLQQLQAGVRNLLDVDYDYFENPSDDESDEPESPRSQSQSEVAEAQQPAQQEQPALPNDVDAVPSGTGAHCSRSCEGGSSCWQEPAAAEPSQAGKCLLHKSKSTALLNLFQRWCPTSPPTHDPSSSSHPVPHSSSLPNLQQLDEAVAASASASHARQGAVPIVFLHGVGFGMLPYLALVRHLMHDCPTRPFICLEMRHVSLRLCKTAAEFDDIARNVVEVMQAHGYQRACFVGHSFGTFVISRLMQLYPEAVDSVCVMDPVAMLLCYPKTLHNFIYKVPNLWLLAREPLRTIVDCARWACARDMLVAETFCRRFWWQSLVLWPQQLPEKSMVVLSGEDTLVASNEIRELVRKVNCPARVVYNPKEFHGSFLVKPALLREVSRQIRDMLDS